MKVVVPNLIDRDHAAIANMRKALSLERFYTIESVQRLSFFHNAFGAAQTQDAYVIEILGSPDKDLFDGMLNVMKEDLSECEVDFVVVHDGGYEPTIISLKLYGVS